MRLRYCWGQTVSLYSSYKYSDMYVESLWGSVAQSNCDTSAAYQKHSKLKIACMTIAKANSHMHAYASLMPGDTNQDTSLTWETKSALELFSWNTNVVTDWIHEFLIIKMRIMAVTVVLSQKLILTGRSLLWMRLSRRQVSPFIISTHQVIHFMCIFLQISTMLSNVIILV